MPLANSYIQWGILEIHHQFQFQILFVFFRIQLWMIRNLLKLHSITFFYSIVWIFVCHFRPRDNLFISYSVSVLIFKGCNNKIIWGSLVFKLPLSLPLCVGWGCFLRVWGRDLSALMSLKRYVSQFIACPPSRLAFGAFWAQIRALAAVWRTCVLLTTVFIDWIGSRRSRAQKSALLYNFSRAHFGNVYKHRLKARIVHSALHFWASRCGFVVLSKPTAKPERKSKLWCQSSILCTRSRLISVISKNILGKRFWLEHVCKVCAQSILLLRFCSDSWCEAVLEPSATLRRFCVFFNWVL